MNDKERQDIERDFEDTPLDDTGESVRVLPDSYMPDETASVRSSRAALKPYDTTSEITSPPPDYSHRPLPAVSETSSRQIGPVQPTEPAPTRRGPSTCAIIAATFAVLALSCMLLAFAAMQSGVEGLGRLTGIFPSFGLVTTPTVTIDTSRPTVIDKVEALGRLETVHYQLEKVISGQSTGPLPDFLTSDKILLVAHGEVVAGVDLTKLEPGDIRTDQESGTVTITLPDAEILFTRLDNDKTYVYDRQTGIFSKPDPDLESQVRRAAEQQILQAALEDGILRRAQENAEEVIETLVTGLGYEEVEFR